MSVIKQMTAQRPFLSLIVPVYNGEAHIGRCIDSILSQSFDNIELIIINDGSTDCTLDIVKKYAENDERISIIEFVENRSSHCARQEGVVKSIGKYIWFVDADDEIAPESCQEIFDILKNNSVDVLNFNAEVMNDGNLNVKRVESMQNFVKPYEGKLHGKDVFLYCFKEDRYKFNIWNKVFDSELCKKAFADMTNRSLPKAQDKYEYAVLSYYAKSYIGITDKSFYIYHFGAGITGHNNLDLKQFERYCSMADSFSEIKLFFKNHETSQTYPLIIEKIGKELFDDCFGNWMNNLSSTDKGKGFDDMVQHWGFEKPIAAVANKYWFSQDVIARQLLSSQRMIVEGRTIRTVATFYHSLKNGGVQRVLSGLTKLWIDMGYNVIIITDEEASVDDYSLPDGVIRKVIPPSAKTTRENYNERAKALTQILQDNNVDVMVYHAWVSNILFWDLMVCKLVGVAFVSHCHNIFSMLARNHHAYFAALPDIYRHCDAVMTLGEVDRLFWSNFNNNVFETMNPFTIDPASAPLSSLNTNTIVWVGRISEEKRPLDAIKIMKEVVEQLPDAKMVIVGDGKDKLIDSMQKMIEEEGLSDSITMVGYTLDIIPYYQESSIFLSTSEYEGFMLSLAEAQSVGLPCVMYELPYLTLTKDNKGIIPVPLMATSSAAMEIVSLLSDRNRLIELGKEAKENIMSYRDFDFISVWKKAFDSLAFKQLPISECDANWLMWDTLMAHYRTGAIRSNNSINNLSKNNSSKGLVQGDESLTYQKEIERIKNSMTYRIGELITYLPKYLRGDFK